MPVTTKTPKVKKSSTVQYEEVEEGTHDINYVGHGTDEHALKILGIRPSEETDPKELVYDGYTLSDPTHWGLGAQTPFLMSILQSKVRILKAGVPPVPQDEDPLGANYHPPLWVPSR